MKQIWAPRVLTSLTKASELTSQSMRDYLCSFCMESKLPSSSWSAKNKHTLRPKAGYILGPNCTTQLPGMFWHTEGTNAWFLPFHRPSQHFSKSSNSSVKWNWWLQIKHEVWPLYSWFYHCNWDRTKSGLILPSHCFKSKWYSHRVRPCKYSNISVCSVILSECHSSYLPWLKWEKGKFLQAAYVKKCAGIQPQHVQTGYTGWSWCLPCFQFGTFTMHYYILRVHMLHEYANLFNFQDLC